MLWFLATYQTRLRRSAPWALLGLLALSLRLIYLHQIHHAPTFNLLLGDAEIYDQWARRIAAGDWLGDQVFYQAPLYPYFLALAYKFLSPSLLAIRILQAILSSLACLLLGRSVELFFSRRTGLITAALLALNPLSIYYDLLIQKSVLDTFLLSALLWSLSHILDLPHRRRWPLALGLFTGLLALNRENALIFAAILPVWFLLHHRAQSVRFLLSRLALYLLGLLLILCPVTLRNYHLSGEPHLTTSQLGPNFHIGNNPQSTGLYVPLVPGHSDAAFERQDAFTLAAQALGHPPSPAQVSRYWLGQAFQFIGENPLAWLRLTGFKLLLIANRIEVPDTEDLYTASDVSPLLRILLGMGHFGILLPLALSGLILHWPHRRRLAPLLLLLLSYIVSLSLFYVMGRYRYPLVILLLPLAATGLLEWAQRLTRRSLRPLLPAAAVLVFAAIVSHWPLLSVAGARSIGYCNYGILLKNADRPDLAAEYFQRSIAAADNSESRFHLGILLLQRGQSDQAAGHLQQAMSQIPSAPAAYYLGHALRNLQQPEKAAEQFRLSMRLDPRFASAKISYAALLTARKDFAPARKLLEEAVALEPDNANARVNLGIALMGLEQFSQAADQFQIARRLEPQAADIPYNLGVALLKSGQPAPAAEAFQQALKLTPADSPKLPQIRAMLQQALSGKP